MDNYVIDLIVRYVKAGAIAWVLWFIYAIIYVLWNFKLDLSLYGNTKLKEKDSNKLYSVFVLILWPGGVFHSTNNIVRYVNEQLRRKENN